MLHKEVGRDELTLVQTDAQGFFRLKVSVAVFVHIVNMVLHIICLRFNLHAGERTLISWLLPCALAVNYILSKHLDFDIIYNHNYTKVDDGG